MKALLDILDDFSPRRSANGEVRMRCPFRENHEDGSGQASFFFNPEKNLYNCYSCGEGGTGIRLLTTKFGVSFYDALELVNPFDFDNFKVIDYDSEEEFLIPELGIKPIIDFSKPPKSMLDRGFTKETLRKFKVGTTYDADRDTDVLTIPIEYQRKLIGLKFRIEGTHNFWFSDKFDRRSFLYNAQSWGTAVAVEGETDVWRSYQNGVPNCLGTFGAEITYAQTKLMRDYETLYSAFDNDAAGSMAAELLNAYLGPYTDVMFVPYDAGDPGEASETDWKYGIKHATDYLTYTTAMAQLLGDEYLKVKDDVARRLHKKGF